LFRLTGQGFFQKLKKLRMVCAILKVEGTQAGQLFHEGYRSIGIGGGASDQISLQKVLSNPSIPSDGSRTKTRSI
jgi:hypothetical protein